MKTYHVYIMGGRSGVLYIGVTSDLFGRVAQHKAKEKGGFTAKYSVDGLLYFEEFGDVNNAIAREKQIKGLLRRKKVELIESKNPGWNDLSKGWYDD